MPPGWLRTELHKISEAMHPTAPEPWVADYSWARPETATLTQAGAIGAVRYVGSGNRGRDVTGGEIRSLHDAGLGVGLVWETTQTGALVGSTEGAFDFESANRWADAVGFPEDKPIFFAVDTDVTPDQIRGPVADTFHGALSVPGLRPCRPYGEADMLDILCGELRLMTCGWQSYAWSHGRLSNYRCLFQCFPPIWNDTVDRNLLGPMPTDFLWHPTINYDPSTEDFFDMATIDDLRSAIAHHLGWHVLVDGRPESLSAWLLNIGTMRKRWLPGPAQGSDYPGMLSHAIGSGGLPELIDLGMRASGDPYLALLDLADLEGRAPVR